MVAFAVSALALVGTVGAVLLLNKQSRDLEMANAEIAKREARELSVRAETQKVARLSQARLLVNDARVALDKLEGVEAVERSLLLSTASLNSARTQEGLEAWADAIRLSLPRPTIILGAEETHINLAQLKFSKYLRGLVLPLPLNVVPLPAKWKIKYLPPIELPYKASAADDRELLSELTQDIRERMQAAISEEAGKRDSIFFG